MIAPNRVRLHHRAPEVGGTRVREQRREERAERRLEGQRREHAAEDAEEQRVDVEQAGDDHQRQEARHDEVLDRVDAEHLQRVELLADLARAEVGGDGRAGHAREDDRRHERRELADRREDEEAAEAVDRAEQDEEVAGLQARRAVAERDRRDRAAGTSTACSANRNWLTNSPPYGYGGRIADKIVLPVRIIMSPTCSSRFFVGRNTRSAAARTTLSPPYPQADARHAARSGTKAYAISGDGWQQTTVA